MAACGRLFAMVEVRRAVRRDAWMVVIQSLLDLYAGTTGVLMSVLSLVRVGSIGDGYGGRVVEVWR
jgi:hypothetical protein